MRQLMRAGSGLLLVATAASCVDSPDGRETQISAQRELSSSDAVSIEFTAKNTGAHSVTLEFSWPIADAKVLEVVNNAGATTGTEQAPAFDFTWQLLREGRVVSQRESPQRSTGTIEVGTSGFGGGPIKSIGLAFGGFELKTGEAYTLRILPGPGLGAIVRAKPRVVVERTRFISIGRPE